MAAMLTELLQDVEDQSVEQIVDVLAEVWGTMLDANGNTWGDAQLQREQRIGRFVDFAQRGVLDALREISPPTYDGLFDQYLQDVEHSALIRGVA